MRKFLILILILLNLVHNSAQSYFKIGFSYHTQILGFGLEENSITSYVDTISIVEATRTSLGTGDAYCLEYNYCQKEWIFSVGIEHFNSKLTQNKKIDLSFQRISSFDYINSPITLAIGFKKDYKKLSLSTMMGSKFRFCSKVFNNVRFFNERGIEETRVISEFIDKFNVGFMGKLILQHKVFIAFPIYLSYEAGLQVHNLSYDRKTITEVFDRGIDYTDKLTIRDKYTEYRDEFIESKIIDTNKPRVALKNYYNISSLFLGLRLCYKL
ncbi:MAG: hypothetical protein HOP11_11470 [Saprospiraceae bacterium]|nr:hypothetical protein [Saprospiraceae bacterium]